MSASISAEDIQKMITGNSTEKYIGEAGGHSPILDLVNRLSGQLNQQTAESNLYRGGAGYGGSFMNADQLAAREQGQKLNAKPYGGWGGYGSGNSTMTNTPAQTTPGGPTTYVPPVRGGETTPVDPRNNPPSRYPGGGETIELPEDPTGGYTDSYSYVQPGAIDPRRGDQPTTTDDNPLEAQPGPSRGSAYSPEVWGGNLKPGDPGWSDAWSRGGGPSGGFGPENPNVQPMSATNSASANAEQMPYGARMRAEAEAALAGGRAPSGAANYSDPNVQKIYEQLVRDGMEPSAPLNADSIKNSINAGVPPEVVYANFKAILSALGPKAFNAMHGAASIKIGDPQSMSDGTYVAGVIENLSGRKTTPQPIAPPKDPLPAAGQKSATAPGGENVRGNTDKPPLNPTDPGAPDPTDPYGRPEGVTGSTGVNPRDPRYVPPNAKNAPKNVKVTLPGGGKDWGVHDTPPKGMVFGDTYTAKNGNKVAYTREGRYAVVVPGDDGKLWYDYNTTIDNAVPDLNAPSDGVRPEIGGRAIIGYTMGGNPIYNDNGMFEQGDNATGLGDMTPDAWNNSPDWRPEEPTGGLYGAYTDLAGGNLTDYENDIGQKWRDLSENPGTPDDLAYKNLVAEYNKTPGKGIDEAYGAYDKMLKGNGYSDVEKGAMEGSAVRGLTEGFRQGADEIRRQGARTNNRASAYAAMGSGGAAYGANLGEMNRQNQIKFADEAQRRQEVGASGMTDVAGLSNTKAQFGIGAAGDYAKEMARRKEAGIAGMGDFATYGRGLQSQGLKGLSDMLSQSNADKNNTYAQIAALLGTNVGQSSGGTSKTKTNKYDAGVSF